MLERTPSREPEELLDAAFGAMRGVASPLRDVRELEPRLHRLAEAVERQARRVRLRRRRARVVMAFGGFAAAAGSLLTYWLWSGDDGRMRFARSSGVVMLERAGRSIEASGVLEVGDRLTADSHSYVEFVGPERASVSLAEGSDVTVLDGALRLKTGTVRVKVPKLGLERSFVVEAPGGRVVVHGTTFSVRVVEPEERLCVHVDEGLVRVETPAHHAFVAAGESIGCEPDLGERASPSAALRESAGGESSRLAPPTNSASAKPASGNLLAAQNALFQKALHARRSGDRELATKSFRELIRRYPDSPMAAQARLELERMEQR